MCGEERRALDCVKHRHTDEKAGDQHRSGQENEPHGGRGRKLKHIKRRASPRRDGRNSHHGPRLTLVTIASANNRACSLDNPRASAFR
jgi:hypothetical protein